MASSTESSVSGQYSGASNSDTPGGAMLAEAEKRGYGTSDADLRAYSEAGGGAAAAAGCAAVGAAPAAPICSLIGSKIGSAIYSGCKALVGLFGGSDKVKKELERRAKQLAAAGVKTEIDFATQSMTDTLVAAENGIIVLHSQLFPDAEKLTGQQVRVMLKDAGLYLVQDFVSTKYGDRELCLAGQASANGLAIPLLPRVIVTKNERFLTLIANNCDGTPYNTALESLSADDILGRYPEVQAAVSAWIDKLVSTTKTVTGAIINLSSNKEIQSLLAESKALRDTNASLATNKDLLLAELTKRMQYQEYYLNLKRQAALKRVEAERQQSEEFLAATTRVRSFERTMFYVAGGILVASTVAAIVVARRRS